MKNTSNAFLLCVPEPLGLLAPWSPTPVVRTRVGMISCTSGSGIASMSLLTQCGGCWRHTHKAWVRDSGYETLFSGSAKQRRQTCLFRTDTFKGRMYRNARCWDRHTVGTQYRSAPGQAGLCSGAGDPTTTQRGKCVFACLFLSVLISSLEELS